MLGIGFILSGLTPHSVLADPPPANAAKETTAAVAAKPLTITPTLTGTNLMVGRPFLFSYQITNVSPQAVTVLVDKAKEAPITFRFLRSDESIMVSTTLVKARRWSDAAVLSSTGSEQSVQNKVVVKDWSQNVRPGEYTLEINFYLRTQAEDGSSPSAPTDTAKGDAATYVCRIPVTVLPQDVLQLRKDARQLQASLQSSPARGANRDVDIDGDMTLFFAYPGAVAFTNWQQFFTQAETAYPMLNLAFDEVLKHPSAKIIDMLGQIGWSTSVDPARSKFAKSALRCIHEKNSDKALKRLVENLFIGHEGAWSAHPPLIAVD